MAIGFSAELKDKEIQGFLNKITTNLEKIDGNKHKQLLSAFGTIAQGDFFKHFDAHRGPDGAWKAWSRLYAERQKKLGKSQPANILRDKGTLRNSFKPRQYEVDSAGILFYNNAETKSGFPYAYAHDNDDGGRTRLPQRKFMWLSSDALEYMAKASLEATLGEL